MSGIELAACYSFKPHQLGLCGPRDKKSQEELKSRKILQQFKAAYAYYQLIARCNKIEDPFDEQVVRAYWTGNELLEGVPIEEFRRMVAEDFYLPQKASLLPQSALPHHNTHVELIGAVYSPIKFTQKLKRLCKITYQQDGFTYHWGERCEKLSRRHLENLRRYGDI